MRVDGVYFITFRSVTYAQRGERILSRAGVRCGIQRTQRWMEEKGCGYSLRVRAGQFSEARTLLTQFSAPFQRIYGKAPGGRWEEVRP